MVKMIVGAGTSNSSKKYQFSDKNFREIVNYYRLKQVDFNGEYRYSHIISIDNHSKKKILRIYNSLGQQVNKETSGLKFVYFDDGSILKVVGIISNY